MKITIEALSKIYKNGNKALNDIDLHIQEGMFGLLGPNGAGKTTFMRILVTLLKPSSGVVKVNDLDLQLHRADIRAEMGYLPQNFRVFSKLKTWEFLDYVASLAGLRNRAHRLNAVDEMLENVGLFDVRNRQANKLSGGMKRRLGIAQALIGEPKIVIIDEPTTGLDPEERIRFRNLLSEMSRKEIIIILSTHIVGDISSTCRSMAVLEKGRLAFKGSPDGLVSKAKGHVFQVNVAENEMNAIKETYPVISTIPSGSGWDVQIVADKLNGFEGSEVEPTLEHAYVYFMEYEQHQSVVNSTI